MSYTCLHMCLLCCMSLQGYLRVSELFNIALKVGYPDGLGLDVILYYFSIRGFLNSWSIMYDSYLHVIYVGQVYLVNHVV